jgi:peptide deformylase
MTVRPIVTLENPLLRARAQRVREISPETQRLVDDMIDTLRAAPGVGLAAPQIGASQRVIVIEYSEPADEAASPAGGAPKVPAALAPRQLRGGATKPLKPPNAPELYVLVNPEIVRRSKEVVPGDEGCLSIPGFYGTVDRAERVTVKGLNRRGDEIKLKVQGWLARIFQHEIDHLDGVLFIDRAKEVWRIPEDPAGAAGLMRPAAATEGEVEGRGESPAG